LLHPGLQGSQVIEGDAVNQEDFQRRASPFVAKLTTRVSRLVSRRFLSPRRHIRQDVRFGVVDQSNDGIREAGRVQKASVHRLQGLSVPAVGPATVSKREVGSAGVCVAGASDLGTSDHPLPLVLFESGGEQVAKGQPVSDVVQTRKLRIGLADPILRLTGLIRTIGEENVFTAGSLVGDSVLEAERFGRTWLAVTAEHGVK
jgi:hypothetical protein